MAEIISTIVNVNITAESANPTLPGFGIPGLHAYHTHNTDLIRTYTDLADMVTDGFSTTEPAYYLASAVVRQNPRPPVFKVIRGTTSVQQTFTFLVTSHDDGDVVGLTITSPAGVATAMYVTASSQSTSQIATALALLVPSGVTAIASSSTVTFTVTASGNIWYPSAIKLGSYSDTTSTSSPDDDLTAAALVDPDFYGVSISQLGKASINDAADWVADNKRVLAYTSADEACRAVSSGNVGIMATLHGDSNDRAYGQYSGSPMSYGATGVMAKQLTTTPGSATMAYKTILGTTVDSLTPTQEANITSNNGNFYVTVAGVPVTIDGRTASGQFMDITRGIDGLTADMQLRVFTALVNSPKVPYTTKGIASIGAEVSASLQSFVDSGFISNDPGEQFQVSVPSITSVSTSDKLNRILRNVNFTAVAQGAIQKVIINGTLSF